MNAITRKLVKKLVKSRNEKVEKEGKKWKKTTIAKWVNEAIREKIRREPTY